MAVRSWEEVQLACFEAVALEIVEIEFVSLDFVEAFPFGIVVVALSKSISVELEALACFWPMMEDSVHSELTIDNAFEQVVL